jgi:hypothetical protein
MPADLARPLAIARGTGAVLALAGSGWVTAWLLGWAASAVSGSRNASWIVGRASGVTAYLLLLAVTAAGLALSHPARTRYRRPSTVTRIRAHAALATFALTFTGLHVLILATDSYAGVGWRGALVPLGSHYRPVPVTLGVIGLYAGLLAGGTAALAGRVSRRLWWPLHRSAAVTLLLVWLHGVLAGSDTPALSAGYVVTGLAVLALAVSRYVTASPGDGSAELAARSLPRPGGPG